MHFLKLIRPINLAIIVLTMYGVHYYITTVNYYQKVDDHPIDFFLLVFSTVLIAAGGNIINDYFDVRADRINKPEKLIISKHIKRRWAILTHWSFNGIAFCIAIYLSIRYQTLWLVFIHLLSINVLWFYSMLFKRKVLIGNLLIAGLTGLVPLLAMVYFKVSNWHYLAFSEFDPTTWTAEIDYGMIYFLAAFAFIQNLAREVIKDMQDIKGDELIYVKSLPMVIGEWKSLQFVCALLLLLPLFLIILLIAQIKTFLNMDLDHFLLSSVPFLITTSLNVLVVILIYKKRSEKLKLYDILIKLSMLIGVLSSFYLASI